MTGAQPLTGVFTSDIGGLNQWVHIWAYQSLDERVAVRKKAIAGPPSDAFGHHLFVAQRPLSARRRHAR